MKKMNAQMGKGRRGARMIRCAAAAGVFVLGLSATTFASTVSLSWDPAAGAGIAGYKVYYQADSATAPFSGGGAAQGASPVDSSTQTSATITGLDPSHAYYFAVTAYNSDGVESAYSNTIAIPELVPPTVSISSPANSTLVSGTVSVGVSASDNVGVTQVEFYVNGALQGTDTGTPYFYSWNTSSLASGTYTLMAKAYDAAGNIGQSAVTVNVVNDTTAPTVSLTGPANGATVSGTVALAANAGDNVGVTKVELYQNGVLLSAGNVLPYSYAWNTTTVSDGSYTLTAKAYDAAGNTQSAVLGVTVKNADTTDPSVTAFSMPSTATSLTVPVTTLTASDNVGVTAYLVTESAGAPLPSATNWSATAPTSFTFSGSGARTAYAWAKDAAGNVSASRSDAVSITLPAPAPFTIGETSVNTTTDSGNGNALVAQQVTLIKGATISSMSFYVAANGGKLRLGIYDATGPNGGPGQLKTQTAEFTPVTGWNTKKVTSSVALPAGTYWLAYLASSNALGYKVAESGNAKFFGYTYGALPTTFSRTPSSGAYHWSFYATLQ